MFTLEISETRTEMPKRYGVPLHWVLKTSQARLELWQELTKIGNHDRHFFIDHVEDHDDDEADEGSGDGCGCLWGQILLDWVCSIQVLGKFGRKHNEHRESIDDDPND